MGTAATSGHRAPGTEDLIKVIPTSISDVIELVPQRHGDDRGWFSETFNQQAISSFGIDVNWVQDNESFSAAVGTLRGLHYQIGPFAQDKLVRVLEGAVLDVAVDFRRSSATFGQHVAIELSAATGNQLFVPRGFGHGFCTLESDTRFAYKVSSSYDPSSERAVAWNDPELAIQWPNQGKDVLLSAKDQVAPAFADQPDLFD